MLNIIELKIRKITKNRGWTIKYLCEKVGVTQAGLSYIFKENSLKVELLIKIAEVLNVNICSFFEENSDTSSVKNYQRGKGNINEQNTGYIKKENNTGILEEKIKSLEAQLKLKDEIIELLRK